MSNTLDLGALRALVEAMTPGPWAQRWMTDQMPPCEDYPTKIVTFPEGGVMDTPFQAHTVEDAAGIVALRNSADALLSRLEAAEGRVAALTAALGERERARAVTAEQFDRWTDGQPGWFGFVLRSILEQIGVTVGGREP